ncbi:MAG: hypothetical protein K1060chlam5_00381 [Candidatus Anoxychlamydiales bacterium]|nr:hypothetical protein [Candidatus Anoxychlamydiales bacterium]
MSVLEKYSQDFFLLLESGFIAVNQMDEESSIRLFKAAEILNNKNPLSKIGFGYLHLHKLELKKAITLFEGVLKEDPKNEMAKTFMGIALSMTPNDLNKGENLLEQNLKSDNADIKKLAQIALDFVDRFVKKEPSPVEGKKKKKD